MVLLIELIEFIDHKFQKTKTSDQNGKSQDLLKRTWLNPAPRLRGKSYLQIYGVMKPRKQVSPIEAAYVLSITIMVVHMPCKIGPYQPYS